MTIRGVRVAVDCGPCKGSGWVPDEAYRARNPNSGALMRCPCCKGRKTVTTAVSRETFKKWLEETMTVNEIRKMTFEGEASVAVALLLKELDLARASAMGYGGVCIGEGICDAEECDDITGWKKEAEEAGII